MLIKFFPNGKGGGAGPVDYLTARTVLAYDENRDLIRDASGQPKHVTRYPLPEILRGDAAIMTDLIDACPHKWSYRAGVISFAEGDQPSEEEQRRVIDRFEELAFAGLDGDQYACMWVRHTHEDRVELHFCTPRMELHSGRSLNIAPPGYERAFDSLRDLMNKEHDWADPMDAARTAETKKVAEAPDRAAGREALHGWIRDQIYEGLITDRAMLIEALKDAGFEVPRAGKNYLTVKDPDTDERWRLKGEFFHEDWTAEAAIEREAERGPRADAHRERRLDGSSVAELQDRFEDHCRKRAGYNQDRYRILSVAREEASDAAEREHREDGHDAFGLDGADSLLRGGERDDHSIRDDELVRAEDVHAGDHGDGSYGRDLPNSDWGTDDVAALHASGSTGGLSADQKGVSDGWSDTVRTRVARLRRTVDAGLESLSAGIGRLRGTMDARGQGRAGWVEALRDRVGQVTSLIDRCLGRLDAGRSDLRAAIFETQDQLGDHQESRDAPRHGLIEDTDGEERHGLRH
ncbi:relaxase/mobilization nuclease domain-containing protein [uncultured Sulfitobacter sp.]|uniref:relaxase/mobilization nuclease domain-containing protein n=1 Tax=uncultured Sulfitobacter sp. TaxID=191468 RepID=UPI00263A08DA|nr:relaxase/mobilization nuclease domain-containing protein [uncultured Sulfitobacter sp.]